MPDSEYIFLSVHKTLSTELLSFSNSIHAAPFPHQKGSKAPGEHSQDLYKPLGRITFKTTLGHFFLIFLANTIDLETTEGLLDISEVGGI